MKTDTHFIISRSILLRMRNVADKSCGENRNAHFCSKTFFPPRQSCRLCENLESYCITRQATEDTIIRRRRIACWIRKAIDTQSVQYLKLFLGNKCNTNGPQCYGAHTLPVLFSIKLLLTAFSLFCLLTQRVISRSDHKLSIFLHKWSSADSFRNVRNEFSVLEIRCTPQCTEYFKVSLYTKVKHCNTNTKQ